MVASGPVTPAPAVGVCPAATVSGGQIAAHCPLQRFTPGLSLSKVYSVWLLAAATTSVPMLPTLCAITSGAAADGDGLGVAVGVAVAEAVAEELADGAFACEPQAARTLMERPRVITARAAEVSVIIALPRNLLKPGTRRRYAHRINGIP